MPNPARRQLSREADRSLTATITLSTQIMLNAETFFGGYRQTPWDASGHKIRPTFLLGRFIWVVLVAIIDVQAPILTL
jgi:hypothetical protein